MENIYLIIVLAPLAGAIIAGFFGGRIGRAGAHWVASTGVGVSALLSLYVLRRFLVDDEPVFNQAVYTWMVSEGMRFEIGFLVDRLTALMMSVVTFVSFCVHIYTIGYMADDEHNWPKTSLAGRNSYQRFFSYISLFTFSMLMLVMANNFLQLFFGWEAVGLVSYLLIGFWSTRESAIFANMKAFLVNRVGDFGFLLGIAAIAMYFGSIDYAEVFAKAPELAAAEITILGDSAWSLMSVICILLFIGAMGKSAQVPLHVWLPDTMEGPTPISALIHAATRVTAGIFHLMTHAFFKALLFLAAGSVIIGMHHDQDIRNMGGVRKYMPITHWTALLGSLALIGFPGFSGFFSKDAIIESVHHSQLAGSDYAYWLLLIGVFVTALYSFRMYFLVFHGEGPRDEHAKGHLHESPWVVTLPLILLAIPSVLIGWFTVGPLLFGDYFDGVLHVAAVHDTLGELGKGYHGPMAFVLHGVMAPPFWLAMAGLATAWFVYMRQPKIATDLKIRFDWLYFILARKYGFDEFNQAVFAAGSRGLGKLLWLVGDRTIIDGLMVNGSARAVGWVGSVVRFFQTGYLNHYAIVIIVGLLGLLSWFVIR
ncbi:MAG: NADH-quinone oxidoreductase subunit L [Gammaproteobacteria bacterium]